VPDPGYWSVRFDDPMLSTMVTEARATEGPSDVVVAILDSCPTRDEVTAAAARYGSNELLQRVANSARVHIDEPGRSIPAAYFQRFDHVLPNWRNHLAAFGSTTDPAFLMKDHGLFAAGLVHDIVPNCDLHLIRVLSDYGIGDLWALASALTRAPELIGEGQRLVVNLSLGVAIPPGEQFLRAWLPATYAGLEATLRESPDLESALKKAGRLDVQETLKSLHAPLESVVDWLAGQERVLLVAAAGNDNDDLEAARAARAMLRPEPRWPARYDRVFGVAAVGTAGQPSRFSNRGDVSLLGNGVATLGGDTSAASAGGLGSIEVASSRGGRDAVVGIFSAEDLPLGGGTNKTGWAYWAGTSFATPIVSAVAACVWAQRRRSSQSGSDVISDVTSRFAQNTAAAGSDRLDVPTIAARQEVVPS
jgi:hypothetical protein